MKRFQMKKLIGLLLLLSMLLVACAQSEPTVSDETAVQTTETEETTTVETEPSVPEGQLALVLNNMTEYILIAPEKQGSAFKDAIGDLRTAFVDRYSLIGKGTLRQTTDRTAAVAKEILVGETSRQESADVLAALEPNSYTIRVVNEKLVIIGTDVYRTMTAIEYFIKTYLTGGDSMMIENTLSVTQAVTGDRVVMSEHADLRLMSWNVLGPSIEDNSVWAKQLDTVMYYLPDIIGFQECNKEAHQKVLSKLYDSHAIAAKQHANSDTYCYTPILYNISRFNLKEGGVEWLRGRYTGTNTKCYSWAVLEDKKNDGALIAVLNFHGAVASNSYSGMENMSAAALNAQANEWRKDNILQMEERITALEATYGTDMAIFVMGDYNAAKGSEPYNMMINYGYSDPATNAVTSAMTGLSSTHTMGQAAGKGNPIDHIFFSADRGVTAYVHALVTDQNTLDASDHLPVYVDFAFEPVAKS